MPDLERPSLWRLQSGQHLKTGGAVGKNPNTRHFPAAAGPFDVDHHVQGTGRLKLNTFRAQPGERTQCREPGGNGRSSIRVDGSAPAAVAGVHGCQ
jgi:hypothetical protein